MDDFNEIMEMDLPEIEKLARAFDWATSRWTEGTRQELELARAMGDSEAVIREQVKLSMMEFARGIFQDCFRRVMGRRAWDD